MLEELSSLLDAPILISLFDYSGTWSLPYRLAGYRVLQVDKKLGFDILKWNYEVLPKDMVLGIIAAPPCTDYASSGAQYWPAKDKDGRTKASNKLIRLTLDMVEYFDPAFWALENPVGRLAKLFPELGDPWYWQPWMFGDPWTKKSCLWGKFRQPKKRPVTPLRYSDQGGWTQLLGGNSERTKELRSITPPGFAFAFFEANDPMGVKLTGMLRAA